MKRGWVAGAAGCIAVASMLLTAAPAEHLATHLESGTVPVTDDDASPAGSPLAANTAAAAATNTQRSDEAPSRRNASSATPDTRTATTKPGATATATATANPTQQQQATTGPAPVLTHVDGAGLYVVDVDGTHMRRITNRAQPAEFPTWSPDSKHLAFMRTEVGYARPKWPEDHHLCRIDADGANARRLPSTGGLELSWGTTNQIVYITYRAYGPDLFMDMVDADGAPGAVVLAKGARNPAWSPVTGHLAYTYGGAGVVIRSPDGSTVAANLAGGAQPWPRWSPDGTRILNGTGIARIDGSVEREVNVYASNSWTDWGPDAQSILVQDSHHGNVDNGYPAVINRYNLDGTLANVVADLAIIPRFSQDAGWVAIIGQDPAGPDTGAHYDLQLVRADGTGRHTLVASPPGYQVQRMTWSPDGKRIAFIAEKWNAGRLSEPDFNPVC